MVVNVMAFMVVNVASSSLLVQDLINYEVAIEGFICMANQADVLMYVQGFIDDNHAYPSYDVSVDVLVSILIQNIVKEAYVLSLDDFSKIVDVYANDVVDASNCVSTNVCLYPKQAICQTAVLVLVETMNANLSCVSNSCDNFNIIKSSLG